MVSNEAAIQLGITLSLEDVIHVARKRQRVADLSAEVEQRVQESANWVKEVVEDIELKRKEGRQKEVKAYYGINTGFGANAGKAALPSEHLTKVLSRKLVTSHSAGAGEYFDEETVRAAMLIRGHTLAKGYSGVRPEIISKLIAMLNKRVYPAVPCKGSLGASGDLAPLSHLALVISKALEDGAADQDSKFEETSGEAFVQCCGRDTGDIPVRYHLTVHRDTDEQTLWRRVSGAEAMKVVGGQEVLLAKEGLALNNGATFSAAAGALTLYDAWNLLEHSELALSMTLEAIHGFQDPFFPEIHRLRPHPGAQQTAEYVLRYVKDSKLLDPGNRNTNPKRIPPQDPYSVRCAPQVLGTIRDTLKFVQGILEVELNAATDNPLIFMQLPRDYKTVSGGNFHGEPIAMAMDFLGIAITELGNTAERRIFKLTDYKCPQPDGNEEYNLPNFLIPNFLIKEEDGETSGLNSGFMIAQYTAASLVSDCKTLAHPDSVDSIPSSANKEDHVSMSLNAARHAREIVDNIETVIAIEFLCAAQALSLRLEEEDNEAERLGAGTRVAYQRIRKEVDYLKFDRALYPDVRKIVRLIRSGELIRLAREATE